jgi:hypothetical protein
MATVPASTPGSRADSREVREGLEKVLASTAFAGAPRVQQFLRFVVEETLAGRVGDLKESVVAALAGGATSIPAATRWCGYRPLIFVSGCASTTGPRACMTAW